MGIIGTIIIGLIVGLIARFLKPGNDSMGWIMTILLGIGGSLLATYGGQALGLYEAGEGAGFIGAVVGAIILLVIYGMITSRKPRFARGRSLRPRSLMFGCPAPLTSVPPALLRFHRPCRPGGARLA